MKKIGIASIFATLFVFVLLSFLIPVPDFTENGVTKGYINARGNFIVVSFDDEIFFKQFHQSLNSKGWIPVEESIESYGPADATVRIVHGRIEISPMELLLCERRQVVVFSNVVRTFGWDISDIDRAISAIDWFLKERRGLCWKLAIVTSLEEKSLPACNITTNMV